MVNITVQDRRFRCGLVCLLLCPGTWQFKGEGEQGMIDWGAIVLNSSAVAAGKKGLNVLATAPSMVAGTCHAPYSMARTLGDPSGQTVATNGRKLMVAWIGNGTCESQPIGPRSIVLPSVECVHARFCIAVQVVNALTYYGLWFVDLLVCSRCTVVAT